MIDFDKFVDEYLKKGSKPKGIGRYYPSEVGICLRKVWYSYKYPSELSPELIKIFEMGNIIHDFVVDVLKSEKTNDVQLLESEFPFKEQIQDFLISGRIDNLIKVKSDGKIYLVEVKSTKDVSFVKEASPHNIVQLQLYMHFLGVHDGLLLYVDKTNLKSKVFEVEYDREEAERIIKRFSKLHKHLTENTLPEPEARVHKNIEWMCKFCEYKDRCHKDTPEIKNENSDSQ